MRRRDFIAGAAGAVAWPLATRAQQGDRVRRVGVLLFGNSSSPLAMFREGLAKFGWVEGRNVRIDYRFSASDPARIAANAEELVNLRPDVIFAIGGPTVSALKQRTQTIPIVFFGGGDAVDNNLVDSVARPTGNVTGFANFVTSLGGKWLQLLKEAVPNITRVAHVFDADLDLEGFLRSFQPALDAAAAQLAITVVRIPLRSSVEIERDISRFADEPNGGLLMTGPGVSPAKLEVLRRLVLQYRLPEMYGSDRVVAETVLMSWTPDVSEILRGAASYVDRILRGAKPSELPVQYPNKYQLVVNLKTAKAIGVTIPQRFLLLYADEVIE